MKNLKLELFNFKKNLSLDEEEISNIVENHMVNYNDFNEKPIVRSLNEKLKPYTYDKKVKGFLENLNNDLEEHELLYELKNLYNILNQKNQGEIYRQPINVLLQTINLDSDEDRMSKILNELAIYDWVPEIKVFVHNLSKSPQQKTNLLSSGNAESVYTIVETVEDGHLAFIEDVWFLFTDTSIEKTLLENYIKDTSQLQTLRLIENALQYACIEEDRINFRISEDFVIGISIDSNLIYINDDELNKDTTLESLFNSPIVPIVNKNFYPMIVEVSKNVEKFVELDVVKKVTNMINPYLRVYAFNYKDLVYLYRIDSRYGNSFFKYESAVELVNEVKNELNYDLTYFYENKIDQEQVKNKKLEDKEREITVKLEDVNFNISKIKNSLEIIGESKVLKEALNSLNKRKKDLDEELYAIKEIRSNERLSL